jgi:hypothetical protein
MVTGHDEVAAANTEPECSAAGSISGASMKTVRHNLRVIAAPSLCTVLHALLYHADVSVHYVTPEKGFERWSVDLREESWR